MAVRTPWAAVVVALLGFAPTGWLCRYTVRDIGYLDLGGPGYQLSYVAAAAERLPEDANAALAELERDSNVRYERVNSGLGPEHPAIAALGEAPRGWVLGGPGGRQLVLRAGDAETAVREALDSPLRRELRGRTLETFAFTLLVESGEPGRDQLARGAIERAREGLAALESQLPRPLGAPLRALEIGPEDREAERVLLWSLGLDSESSPERPAIALVYGRGKRAGAPVSGAGLEGGELLSQLALVGESCECETPRDWFLEPAIPMVWGASERAAAPGALGFDPQSPMVAAEVARILASGSFGGAGPPPLEGPPPEPGALLFGYRELQLQESAGPSRPRDDFQARRVPGAAPGGVRVVESASGDWGFANEQEPVEAPRPGPGAPAGDGTGMGGRFGDPSPGVSELLLVLLPAGALLVGAIVAAVALAGGRRGS